MIRTILACALALTLCSGYSRADDKSDQDAKAALLMGGIKSKAIAPMPSLATLTYPKGHEKSLADSKPLVVFVGCDVQKVPGAIVSRVAGTTFGDVKGPAVVVGYPQGHTLYIDSSMPCPVLPADLTKAVAKAARKIELPPQKMPEKAPSPAGKDWQVNAEDDTEFIGFRTRGSSCANGSCVAPTATEVSTFPQKTTECVTGTCPVATSATSGVSVAPVVVDDGRWYFGKNFGRKRR